MNEETNKKPVNKKAKYTLEELSTVWQLTMPDADPNETFFPKSLYWKTFHKFHVFTSTYFPHTKLSTVVEFFEVLHRTGLNARSKPEIQGFFPFTIANLLDSNEGLLGREISTLHVRKPHTSTPKTTLEVSSAHTPTTETTRGNSFKGSKGQEESESNGNTTNPNSEGNQGGVKALDVKGIITTLAHHPYLFNAFPLGFAKNPNTPVEKLNELIEHEESTVRTAAYVSLQILSTVDNNFQPIPLQK